MNHTSKGVKALEHLLRPLTAGASCATRRLSLRNPPAEKHFRRAYELLSAASVIVRRYPYAAIPISSDSTPVSTSAMAPL